MRRGVTFLLVLIGAGLGTALAGWWSLAPIAAAAMLADRSRYAAARTGTAAALAWAALLWRDAAAGPARALAGLLGEILPVGGAPGFIALTLGFAFLLAWSAARVALGVLSPAIPEEDGVSEFSKGQSTRP